MHSNETLEQRIQRLEDLEAIKQVKYRYFRALDTKRWDELADCFAPDVSVSYGEGRYSFAGREAVMRFLTESLSVERGSVTIHHGHHPEIEITGADSARGTWALYNYMFNQKENRGIRIGAYYHDEYVRLGGRWQIKRIGYTYLFFEEWKRDDIPSTHLVAGG